MASNQLNRFSALCLIIAAVIVILFTVMLVYQVYWHAGGNHSFLFGTGIDRFLLDYGKYVAGAAAVPWLLPLFFKQNVLTGALSLLGIAAFFYVYTLIRVLTD